MLRVGLTIASLPYGTPTESSCGGPGAERHTGALLRADVLGGPDDMFIAGDVHQRIYDKRI
jgi:hypothetical protein